VYDFKTYLAVRDFQKTYNLPVTGIAGKKLWLRWTYHSFPVSEVRAQSSRISDEQLLARAINGKPEENPTRTGGCRCGYFEQDKDPRFPKTIAGVIYQPGAFTAVSDGQINVPIDPNSTVVKAARDALNGWDPTNGCIYYWNPATATSKWIWSRKIVTKIGKHYFGI